jgi:putative membrane protein
MISWWCTALTRPWTWKWIPYPGIWVASIVPLILYSRSVRRHRGPTDWTKVAQFGGGMLAFWVATDWPLGTLGAGYLASAHMTQFLLYTLVSAPLLLLGLPEWMARDVVARLKIEKLVGWLGNSLVVSGLVYNVVLVTTHAPGTVQALRTSQLGWSSGCRSSHRSPRRSSVPPGRRWPISSSPPASWR